MANPAGITTSTDWSYQNNVLGNKDHNDPLALHNLPTGGSVFHHEHAPGNRTSTSSDAERTTSHVQSTRARLGLHPTAPIIEEHDTADHADNFWVKVRAVLKEPLAEFFGVLIMVCFGDGSVAQVLLSQGQATAPGGMSREVQGLVLYLADNFPNRQRIWKLSKH